MGRRAFGLCALLVTGSAVIGPAPFNPAQAGDIYCNAARTICSDVQSPGSQLVYVRGSQGNNQGNSGSQQVASSNPGSPPASGTPTDEATRQAVQKDVAANRADACKKAQERYEQAINARRIYKENKAGEREYLTDEQADAQRVAARTDRDTLCGAAPPTPAS